ncbi:MAG: hypothetical protein B6I24_06340 [Bacteroidetes bacterium 4572_128]|nr:MAG: hypothetical protein B6I24_06340 [Bacteroidetes bacterium 4572_128]
MDKKIALKRVSRLCSTREKCISEIRNKLISFELEEKDIEEIICFLKEHNFLNEERYAQFFVNDKLRFNKWGKLKVKNALKQKKIPEIFILKAIENFSSEEYFKIIEKEIYKKKKTLYKKNQEEQKRKLINFSISRGFELEIIMKILK